MYLLASFFTITRFDNSFGYMGKRSCTAVTFSSQCVWPSSQSKKSEYDRKESEILFSLLLPTRELLEENPQTSVSQENRQ